jgi:hypothetical protein
MNVNQKVLMGAGVLFLALVLMSLVVTNGQGPDAWLQEWTDWAAKYIALVVSVQSVVKLVDSVSVRLKAVSRDT